MRFTIITVTKNNKAGLLRAIECVRSQTYQNVEHIIVDGGSTDGSVELLRHFDKLSAGSIQKDSLLSTQYSLLTISEADSGIYDAINKGIKLATGDVIGLLHSDDLFADENVIAGYAEVFNNHNVDAVYSDLVYVTDKIKDKSKKEKVKSKFKVHWQSRVSLASLKLRRSGPKEESPKLEEHSIIQSYSHTIIRYWKARDPSTEFIPAKAGLRMTKWIKKGWMPPHPTLFIRKEIFEKYGLYNTSFKIAADYEMILRLFYKHKITSYYLPLTTYYMQIGGASNKSIKNIIQKSKEDLRAMKMNGINFPMLTLICKNFRKLPQFLARDLSNSQSKS